MDDEHDWRTHSLRIYQRSDGPRYVWSKTFQGEGANYGLMLTLGVKVTLGQ